MLLRRLAVTTPRRSARRALAPACRTMGCGASAPAGAAPAGAATVAAPGAALSTAAGSADGGCFISAVFAPLKLTGVLPYNHDSKVFEFGLPEGQSLNLPVCACILLKGKTAEGEDAVRPCKFVHKQ